MKYLGELQVERLEESKKGSFSPSQHGVPTSEGSSENFSCRHGECEKQYNHRQSRNRHEKHKHSCQSSCRLCPYFGASKTRIIHHSFHLESKKITVISRVSEPLALDSASMSNTAPANLRTQPYGLYDDPFLIADPKHTRSQVPNDLGWLDSGFPVETGKPQEPTDLPCSSQILPERQYHYEPKWPISSQGLLQVQALFESENSAKKKALLKAVSFTIEKLMHNISISFKDVCDVYEVELTRAGRSGPISATWVCKKLKSLLDVDLPDAPGL